MKKLVRESLETIGAHVTETDQGELTIVFPNHDVLEGPCRQLNGKALSFTTPSASRSAVRVSPGSFILDTLGAALSEIGACRHWRLPVGIRAHRNELRGKIRIWAGEVERFSMKKNSQLDVRCFFRLRFASHELLEELIAIEVPSGRSPRLMPDAADPPPAGETVDRPAGKLGDMGPIIEAAFKKAEGIARDKAEAFRSNDSEKLYKTLNQLKQYYLQVKTEALIMGDDPSAAAAGAEYQHRKAEEIQKTTMRAEIALIALETVSTLVSRLTYVLRNGEANCKISSLINLADGSIIEMPVCESCQMETNTIGLTASGRVVCPICHATCHSCGEAVIAPNAQEAARCSVCGDTFCPEHSLFCNSCKRVVCLEHASTCAAGCRICKACERVCVECGHQIVWCRDHVVTNHKSEAICRGHVVYCSGCRAPHSVSRIQSCAACGQNICAGCSESCSLCGEPFCLNHIHEGRCANCEKEAVERKERQVMLC